jgi:F0F1-type ATP synthase delta subunit
VVSTATEMNAEQEAGVVAFLNTQLEKKIIASFKTDRQLMEGIRIQIGTRTIENSVVSRIEQLRRKLIEVQN